MSQLSICALGFDHLGFALRPKTLDKVHYRLDFLSKSEFLGSGLEYDAMIIPSGIFERHKIQPERDGERTYVESETDLIEAMEKRLEKLWQKGGWVCILADSIIDRVNESTRATIVNDTDLSKRIFNRFHIQRQLISGRNVPQLQSPEFLEFFKEYAIPQTAFTLPAHLKVERIYESSQGLLAWSLDRKLYVLPHFRNYPKSHPITEPIQLLVDSILSRRNGSTGSETAMPEWFEEFKFHSEQKVEEESAKLREQLDRLEEEFKKAQSWKRILTAQEAELEEKVKSIFESYFSMKISKPQNSFEIPVWNILGPSGSPIALLACCASEDELKRQHLNTLDNIREKMGLSPQFPCLLVVNDHFGIQGFKSREQKTPSSDKVKHAETLSVHVLRSIDLLMIMRELESLPLEKRQEDLLKRILNNPGLIRAK